MPSSGSDVIMRAYRVVQRAVVQRVPDLAATARAIRRMLGAPDYAAYVEHVCRSHPDTVPMSRTAFMRDVLARRYDRPGSRCC
jgi:uncharacterized short protein YbdD (DUF466 family)